MSILAYSPSAEICDTQLERSVIAYLRMNPEKHWELVGKVSEADFFSTCETYRTLVDAIENKKGIPAASGESEPSIPCVDPFEAAAKLREITKKRTLHAALYQGITGLDQRKAEDTLAILEGELAKAYGTVRDSSAQVHTVRSMFPEIMADLKTRYEERKKSGRSVFGVSSGVAKIDEVTGGFQQGLYVLGAVTSYGKTNLARQFAVQAAQKRVPVIFITFEDPKERLLLKAVCALAGKVAKDYEEGKKDPADLDMYYREYGPSLETLQFVDGDDTTTAATIKGIAYRAMRQFNATRCFIIVDYLQKWAALKKDFSDFRHQVSALVGEMHGLAKTLKSPVMLISSVNRAGYEDKKTDEELLKSLKEAGEIEYSAETAMFLRPAEANGRRTPIPPARAVELRIAKNKFGDRASVFFTFRPDIGTFTVEGTDYADL